MPGWQEFSVLLIAESTERWGLAGVLALEPVADRSPGQETVSSCLPGNTGRKQ